jgi:tricarballylate dehydrogenase
VQTTEGTADFHGRAVILAAGGFEANPEMRARYLGPGWDLVKSAARATTPVRF